MVNSQFLGNSAGDFGGAMQLFNTPATITGCIFSGNSAMIQGGAVYLALATNVAFVNCTFAGNSCAGTSGGIYAADSADATIALVGTAQATLAAERR